MYIVYYTMSDGCTYSSDYVLFVTESEQTAKDAVELAQLEYEVALDIPYPQWSLFDDLMSGKMSPHDCLRLRDEYEDNVRKILTVHPSRAIGFSREDNNS